MSGFERVTIGVLGGLAALLSKFLAQDYVYVVSNFTKLTDDQITSYVIGYSFLTPILLFLGGLVAGLSDETRKYKLLALGIAAPAIITTWAGGEKMGGISQAALTPVGSAYAQYVGPPEKEQQENKSVLGEVKDGIAIFFGFGREIKKYWVVVGSFKERTEAQKLADRINSESADLNAFVGLRGKEYWPVIVGQLSPRHEALRIKEMALKLRSVTEAFLSRDRPTRYE